MQHFSVFKTNDDKTQEYRGVLFESSRGICDSCGIKANTVMARFRKPEKKTIRICHSCVINCMLNIVTNPVDEPIETNDKPIVKKKVKKRVKS